jgi:ribosome-associated protein
MSSNPILSSEGGDASSSALSSSVGGPTLDVPGVASIPLAEIEFEFIRSSGPGGQNVNKVASKARLRWRPGERLAPEVWGRFQRLYPSWTTEAGEIVVSSQKFRDAPKNKAECLEKLRAALEKAGKEPKKRIPTKPTRGSILRRLEDKKRNSERKKERGRRDFD